MKKIKKKKIVKSIFDFKIILRKNGVKSNTTNIFFRMISTFGGLTLYENFFSNSRLRLIEIQN